MSDTPSVSDRFREIDTAFVQRLGTRAVENVMADIRNVNLSLRQVAERNGINMGDVVQIARFHKIDPVTLEPTS